VEARLERGVVKRPIPVTILGCLFIVVGLAALAYHLLQRPVDRWAALIIFVEIIAVVGGVFLLKGRNWARWLMIGWVGFHVGLSAFKSLADCIAHAVLFVAVAYFLLTPPDSKYFQASLSE
jgi:phosphatidylglycerophosphate synthase